MGKRARPWSRPQSAWISSAVRRERRTARGVPVDTSQRPGRLVAGPGVCAACGWCAPRPTRVDTRARRAPDLRYFNASTRLESAKSPKNVAARRSALSTMSPLLEPPPPPLRPSAEKEPAGPEPSFRTAPSWAPPPPLRSASACSARTAGSMPGATYGAAPRARGPPASSSPRWASRLAAPGSRAAGCSVGWPRSACATRPWPARSTRSRERRR